MSLGLTPPGPLAGSLVGSGVLVLVLLVLVISSSANACCAEERGPITDCSFSHNQDTFSCDVAELGTYLDTCPDGRSKDLLSVPAPIEKESFNIKPYFTSCLPTLYDMGLKASSCHTPCRHDDEAVHAGLNITFRANDWTSEDLRGIAISLRYDTEIRVQCVEFQFGEMTLTNQALEQHEFYYDGFIGLVPGGKYTVSILTLPTNIAWANSLHKTITIPFETCWVPDVKFHETPFAVNFTLFQDLLYSFTQFSVHLYHNHPTPKTKSVDFSTAELYEIDGKWGTNIIFDCIEPSADKFQLYIEVPAPECPFCAWNMTEIQVKGVPPTFINCPEQDIVHEIEIRRIMDFTAINSVSWLPPTPIFQSDCVYGHNSTHKPNTSLFHVGRTTTVTYSAWQYASLAQCSFNVHVRLVDTVSPTITYCPDNIITRANPRTKTLEVTWPTPTYEDVSETAMTIFSPDISDLQNHFNFPVGTNTTVIYEITDAYDNVANCSFSVYVEETPTASILVIVLSCSGGLLLILIVAVLFWCRTARIRRTREEPDTEYHDIHIAFSPVNPGSMHGIALKSLEECPSQFSINGIVKTPSGHQIHPKSISVPDLGSSGYGSNNMGNNAGEFLPSFGHPRGQNKDRLDSVKEEENNKLLVWKRVDSNDGYSYGSHSSSYYDDSPVSLESTL